MCGIFGFTSFSNESLSKARESLNTLTHRGPDQWNDYHDENVYLGHRRLSIIDVSEQGKQPMVNDKAKVYTTVNGEIYNFVELRNELKKKYHFNSSSDSEVVLHGYVEWGIKGLLERIDGMFAIVLYDKLKGKVYLVRDRSGVKPLHYAIIGKQFLWSSELKAITTYLGENNLSFDYSAICDFYTYQYIPTPKTLYQNIYKLEPACYVEIDLFECKAVKNQFWEVPTNEINISFNEAKEEIRRLVIKSVNEQMVSDVPVGFFLSGGMDSSVIVAAASSTNQKLNTFNIAFENNPKDESKYAELVAKTFNTNHFKQVLNPKMTNDMYHKIKEWYDEPFGDLSCFPSFLVSKLAKKNVTVVLTGDGGDELFGGYKWYKAFSLIQPFKFLTNKQLKKVGLSSLRLLKNIKSIENKVQKAELLFYDRLELYTKLMGGLTSENKRILKNRLQIPVDYDDYWYFRKFYHPELSTYKRLRYLDFHTYLHDDILTKVDRVSMAVSLECRVPFLSKELIEFVFTLSDKLVLPDGQLKGLMKASFTSELPSQILNRPKEGFNLPARVWKDEITSSYNNRFDRISNEVFNLGL